MKESKVGVVYALALASGAAALAHELLWTRRLLDVIGGTAEASARVLGAFFLGLALGASVATRLVPRVKRPLRTFAWIELVIALLCVPAVILPDLSDALWHWLGPEAFTTSTSAWVEFGLSSAIVIPPAFAMGSTLPLLAAVLTRLSGATSSSGIWLYAANTAGGVLGILAVVNVTLHLLGARGSMLAASSLNVAVAIAAALLARGEAPRLPPLGNAESSEIRSRSENPRPALVILALAAFSGVGILAFEIVALHMKLLLATLSFYAPAAILATVIACLVIAAALVPWLSKRFNPRELIPPLLALGACCMVLAPFTFIWLGQRGEAGGAAGSLGGFTLELGYTTLIVLGPSLICMGTLFPLLLAEASKVAGRLRPTDLGWLLCCNGIGGLLGAELGLNVLLPSFGPYAALGVIALGYAGVAAALALGMRRPRTALAALLAQLVVLWLTIERLPRLPTVNPHLGFEVVEVRSDADGTLAVVEHERSGRALVLNNQYVLGSEKARYDQERQGHLPLLLHAAPKRVGFIGLATGSTASASLAHESVEAVEVFELSRAVVDAARRHFSNLNQDVIAHPKVNIIVEDGRTYLASTRARFDVVVGDLFLPWASGAGRLYSVEHFRAVRTALRRGGVYCQWLPLYQLTQQQYDVVVATLLQAFPEVHTFSNGFHPDRPAVALVAFDGELDWSVPQRRALEVRTQARIVDPAMRHVEALGMLYLGRYTAENHHEARVNTLGNLWLELDAGKQRLTREAREIYLFGQRFNDFVKERIERMQLDDGVPQPVRVQADLGFLLVNWGIARRMNHPAEAALRAKLERELPAALRQDPDADWAAWPGPKSW